MIRYLSLKFIQENIRYPKKAIKKGIEGRVICQFTIKKDGSISTENITIIRSPHKLLNKEAIRLIKNMPKWKPGMHEGKKVNVLFALPITFKLR